MTSAQTLYQADFDRWLQETANLLRNGDVEQLDCQNLAAEIEDMAGSRKDALESNLIRVLQHLLKWKYQPQKRTNSWKASKKALVLSRISSKYLLSVIKMQG